MPLNTFAKTQEIHFQIVASRMETTWSVPTYCCRLLFSDGTEIELHACKEAIAQWQGMAKNVPYNMEVPRNCIKSYTGSEKTGIDNKVMLRLMYKNSKVKRNDTSFPLHIYQNHSLVEAEQLQQVDENELINVKGIVHSAGVPPAMAQASHLPRREVQLFDGEWQLSVDFIGELANTELKAGMKIVIVSAKKRAFCGITNLETTRLSFVITKPPWATFAEKDVDSPPRKALKSEVLNYITVLTAKRSNGELAVRVKASMVEVEADIFKHNLWATGKNGDSFRLPLTLRDATGDIQVTFWSAQFTDVIPYNVDELNTMWEACSEGEAAQQHFLDKINVNASKEYSWTLRPNQWKRSEDETTLQWSVHAVSEME